MLLNIAKTPPTLLLEFQITVEHTKILSEPLLNLVPKTLRRWLQKEEHNNDLALINPIPERNHLII